MRHFALGLILICGLMPAAAVSQEQHSHSGTPSEKLGTVQFSTSCNPAVEADFNRATAMLHSFWFNAAIEAYSGTLARDPACAMAYWGLALSYWGNPFGGGFRTPDLLQKGRAAVEKAQAASAKTDRERDYVAAVGELYKEYETRDNRTRVLAYEKAMEQLSTRYPDDKEALIFYALSLDQTALPTDKTYANQLKAAGILEPLFARQPDHPGLAHYIIHTYDSPTLANRALGAAERYAQIAPSAPHALHMPSHTFTRVGYWRESIASNIASADAAERDGSHAEALHAMDYETYAYLQIAEDRAARKVVDQVPDVAKKLDPNAIGSAAPGLAGLFAIAAMPARYALERAAWDEAAALEPKEAPLPFIQAMTHFARALGRARTGKVADARQDVEALSALRDALIQKKDAYWSGQVEIQRKAANAWVAWADGRHDEGLAELRAAADLEDTTDKSAVTPGPLKPARELLGEMLLEASQPVLALQEFEKTMKKEPNRFRGVYGAARAAELSGDRVKAGTYYKELLQICGHADRPGRPELDAARKFLGFTE